MVGIKINWFSIQPHQTSWKTQTPTIPTNGLMGNQTPSNSQLTPLTTHHNPMISPPKAHPIPKNGSMPPTMIGIKFNWLSIQPHEKPMQTPPNSQKMGWWGIKPQVIHNYHQYNPIKTPCKVHQNPIKTPQMGKATRAIQVQTLDIKMGEQNAALFSPAL